MREDVLRPCIALFAMLSLLLSASGARATSGPPGGYHGDPAFAPLTSAKYLVLIVLDGTRPDYLNLVRLPHLDALRASGVQYSNAITGILESETPSGHTTISTGSTPRRNGILGFSWAANDSDYSLFSPDVVRAGAIERIMASARVPTIAGLYKARYPRASVVALSGFKYYAADPLGGPQADAIMYFRNDSTGHYAPTAIPGHVPPAGVLEAPSLSVPATGGPYGRDDHLATQLMLNSFAIMHQRITLINYPDFDWPLGHVDGGMRSRDKVVSLMQIFDQDLGMIEDAYRKAGVLKKTLFVITADHGMSAVWHFVPQTVFTNAVTQAGTSTTATTYSTAAYIWLRNLAKAPAVASSILRARNPGIQSVYYWNPRGSGQYVLAPGVSLSRAADAANRYLLATMVNGHQPTIVTFTRWGYTTQKPTTNWKADHGGSSWEAQHIPLILAGPGVRSGIVSGAPAQLADIAPTVLADMGVRPDGMEGQILTDALAHPLVADRPFRISEISQLTPVVRGMVAQSAVEHRSH